jgi:hypothetical protein
MNLIKQVTAAFPSADAFFKWIDESIEVVDEIENHDSTLNPNFVIVKPLPVPVKSNLILPENADLEENDYNYIWVINLQPASETFIPIYLVPKHGSHIRLPGYKDVFLVPEADVAMAHNIDAHKWSKYW